MRGATDCCIAVGFVDALKRFQRIEDPRSSSEEKPDVSTAIAALKVVQESMYEEMSKRHFLVVALIVSSTLKVRQRYSHLRPHTRIIPFGEVGATANSLTQLPTLKQLEIVLRLSAILRQFSMRCGSRNMAYVFLQSGSR